MGNSSHSLSLVVKFAAYLGASQALLGCGGLSNDSGKASDDGGHPPSQALAPRAELTPELRAWGTDILEAQKTLQNVG